MGRKFLDWYQKKIWTPWGKVFDIGITTSAALARIASGVKAEVSGEDSEYSNGNGSLMRILPVALRFAGEPTVLLDRVHRASAITHRHQRSQMACGLYALVTRELLAGVTPVEAVARGVEGFRRFYMTDPGWADQLDSFQSVIAEGLGTRPEAEIRSSGYV